MEYKISKSDWQRIGSKSGWLKAAYEGEFMRVLDEVVPASVFIDDEIAGVSPDEYMIRIAGGWSSYDNQGPVLTDFEAQYKDGVGGRFRIDKLNDALQMYVFKSGEVAIDKISHSDLRIRIKNYIMKHALHAR
jgi:hypothetical protein